MLIVGETIANLVESLEDVFVLEGIELGKPALQPCTFKQTGEAIEIFNNSWKHIHELILFILKESDNEVQVQQAFYNIQSLIRLAGTAGNELALLKVLEQLCNHQLPENIIELKWECGYKYIFACNTILRTAHYLHGVLKKPGWGSILQALANINSIIYKNKGDLLRRQLDSMHYDKMRKKIAKDFEIHLNDMLCEQEKGLKDNSELSTGRRKVIPPTTQPEEIKDHRKAMKGLNLYRKVNPKDTAIPCLVDLEVCDIQSEIQDLNSSLDSLAVYTVLFDVILRTLVG